QVEGEVEDQERQQREDQHPTEQLPRADLRQQVLPEDRGHLAGERPHRLSPGPWPVPRIDSRTSWPSICRAGASSATLPRARTTTRSASATARSTLCEVSTTERRRPFVSISRVSRSSSASTSSPVSGSSSRRIGGA